MQKQPPTPPKLSPKEVVTSKKSPIKKKFGTLVRSKLEVAKAKNIGKFHETGLETDENLLAKFESNVKMIDRKKKKLQRKISVPPNQPKISATKLDTLKVQEKFNFPGLVQECKQFLPSRRKW